MKTPQEIYSKYHISAFDDIFEHNIDILNAIKEYGKQCFEAAREEEHSSEVHGAETYNYWNKKYNNFQDYIDDLNNNTNE